MITSMTAQFPQEKTDDGAFARQEDAFRDWVTKDGESRFRPAHGRYHLYVSLACPWAHRTLIVRKLKRLESAVGVTVLDPVRDERGWAFRDGPGFSRDPVNGFAFLSEAYHASGAVAQGRWTVPVLWDRETKRIVNNSEDDICRMFNDSFARPGDGTPRLFPVELAEAQQALSAKIYEHVNNGVYRAGFATAQPAYERATKALFETLDELDQRLAYRRFLLAAYPVETDWRLFCTLVRFDSVYHGHFKCNLRRIVDYPRLQGYLQDLYQVHGISGTVNFAHIKSHSYITHREINPTGIVPLGPVLNLAAPHHRATLGTT